MVQLKTNMIIVIINMIIVIIAIINIINIINIMITIIIIIINILQVSGTEFFTAVFEWEDEEELVPAVRGVCLR